LKRTDVYEENWRQQKQFIESADSKSTNGAASINETKNKIIMGRAIAREILCETELSRAKDEYKLFKKQKDFHKFEIENKKTGETNSFPFRKSDSIRAARFLTKLSNILRKTARKEGRATKSKNKLKLNGSNSKKI
jgi:hypothetical protein